MKILPKIMMALKMSLIAFSLVNLSIARDQGENDKPPSFESKMMIGAYYPATVLASFVKWSYASNITIENSKDVLCWNAASLFLPITNYLVSKNMDAHTGNSEIVPFFSNVRNTIEFMCGVFSTGLIYMNWMNPNPSFLNLNWYLTTYTTASSVIGTTFLYKILFPSYCESKGPKRH